MEAAKVLVLIAVQMLATAAALIAATVAAEAIAVGETPALEILGLVIAGALMILLAMKVMKIMTTRRARNWSRRIN